MNTMNTIAYDNLNILNEDKFMTHYLIADGNKLSLIEKDDYDSLKKLGSLEYPIHFTYHHLMNMKVVVRILDDKKNWLKMK